MQLNIRKLNEADWATLKSWWNKWDDWEAPPKDFLPDNGTCGFIVEKNKLPIVAGFIYFTNSKAALLEWIVSNPEYKQSDRQEGIEYLINSCEAIIKEHGFKYIFSICLLYTSPSPRD